MLPRLSLVEIDKLGAMIWRLYERMPLGRPRQERTTMHVKIPHTDSLTETEGPCWKAARFGPKLSANVRCPCGTIATLRDHEIAADGTVTPSVVCPDCDWHVIATLEGWTA